MEKIKTKPYGLHLMIDGYGASPEKLADINLLYKTLHDLPERMGMQRIGFPHIIQITEEDIAGLSGFVFIIESHISIHTYSGRGFISMDAYSCKNFDYKKVIQHIECIYEIKKKESFVVRRGTYFPVENLQRHVVQLEKGAA